MCWGSLPSIDKYFGKYSIDNGNDWAHIIISYAYTRSLSYTIVYPCLECVSYALKQSPINILFMWCNISSQNVHTVSCVWKGTRKHYIIWYLGVHLTPDVVEIRNLCKDKKKYLRHDSSFFNWWEPIPAKHWTI